MVLKQDLEVCHGKLTRLQVYVKEALCPWVQSRTRKVQRKEGSLFRLVSRLERRVAWQRCELRQQCLARLSQAVVTMARWEAHRAHGERVERESRGHRMARLRSSLRALLSGSLRGYTLNMRINCEEAKLRFLKETEKKETRELAMRLLGRSLYSLSALHVAECLAAMRVAWRVEADRRREEGEAGRTQAKLEQSLQEMCRLLAGANEELAAEEDQRRRFFREKKLAGARGIARAARRVVDRKIRGMIQAYRINCGVYALALQASVQADRYPAPIDSDALPADAEF